MLKMKKKNIEPSISRKDKDNPVMYIQESSKPTARRYQNFWFPKILKIKDILKNDKATKNFLTKLKQA